MRLGRTSLMRVAPPYERVIQPLPDCGNSLARAKLMLVLSNPASAVRLCPKGASSRTTTTAEEGVMAKRIVLTLAVTAVIVASLGLVKFKQIQTAIGQAAAFQPPPEAVTTIVAAEEHWPPPLSAIGTAAPLPGGTISGDLSRTLQLI